MTVRLNYRDLQRMSSGKLLGLLGNNVGLVYIDSQLIFKIKVASEQDVRLDSQSTVSKTEKPVTVNLV